MADWKQITARIRRARSGKDPAGQLTNLFSKTRDAMVAFELARFFESSGNTADAGRWYLTAAERFRRADWKTKAQESATRLGATEPAEIPTPPPRAEPEPVAAPEPVQEATAPMQEAAGEISVEAETPVAAPEAAARPDASADRQRRGRRGGRDLRSARRGHRSGPPRDKGHAQGSTHEEPPIRREQSEPVAAVASVAEAPSVSTIRGRSGDPGLASRLTQLEMNFRRLLACTPTKLENADKAPAGPGVWVLTDSDLTTYYYVEACQTLRVAIPNLLRGGSARRGESIKPMLAEHLGIPESRVAKYLSEHCVVRWLQLDENASHFAHFLIAVLRPALNA
jgi:hypothetical protein